ncbi:MAG: hypothetical protein LBG52_08865 [Candidatus Peribacteria bacterium]|nr:hypothetical protein [Candidatus Peribacteria bacterium]
MTTSRKEVLLSILEHLVGHWDLAEGFLVLVKSTENEEFVEELYGFIREQIKGIKDSQQKERITKQLQTMKKYQEHVQAVEQQEHEGAEHVLDALFCNEG